LIVTCAVPLVVDVLRLTVCPLVHVGRFVAFAGVEVTAHDSVTVPVYPVAELTVIVEVPGVPAVTVTAVPDSVKPLAVTVTALVFVAALYTAAEPASGV
jgi:hypothetical protein